jgi:hypothetical protein
MMRSMLIPIFVDRFGPAWPKATSVEDKNCATYVPIGDAMMVRASSDGHFACYSVPYLDRRLAGYAPSMLDDGVPMVLAAFDVDDPIAHAQDIPARPEWRAAEEPKLDRLLAAHPGGFAFDTRGGLRIVYALPEPFVVKSIMDAAQWKATYKSWCRYLARAFDIAADERCGDWARLFRMPYVRRDGVDQVPRTRGDASAIGPWAPEMTTVDMVEPQPVAEISDEELKDVSEEREAKWAELSDDDREWFYMEATSIAGVVPPSIAGQGGDLVLLRAACALYEVGLPARVMLDVLRKTFNPRCLPPWPDHRLVYKVGEAAKLVERERRLHELFVGMLARLDANAARRVSAAEAADAIRAALR